ncbi:MAG TPA: beta-glucosidase [Candidatus Limnocylindria bacterium]|nr:beta-glucosidase [Candidatus Limnocylindria bacterium]
MKVGETILFPSFFIGGFEGSTHRRRDGRRLDLVAATQHDSFAQRDYARLVQLGIRTARESLRWHLIEATAGKYDFSMEVSRAVAARDSGVQVIWDLAHFGWPDHVDVFSQPFPEQFASYATAAARWMRHETDAPLLFAPMNEMSFLAWAGGEVGIMNPHASGRGVELKRQLARANIRAIDAIRNVDPAARFIQPEPLINVVTDPERSHERATAADQHESQFEAWDLLAGRLEPALGGSDAHLDVLGVNYYPNNQWIAGGTTLPAESPLRVELSKMLVELHARYGRPIVISETGTEGGQRAAWVRGVSDQVRVAMAVGVPVVGICLYPILNHPGWEDDRHCHNGLWDYAGVRGGRRAYVPMRRELVRLRHLQSH